MIAQGWDHLPQHAFPPCPYVWDLNGNRCLDAIHVDLDARQ
ncbi:hypothetical protein [Modicisalibacter luteus]